MAALASCRWCGAELQQTFCDLGMSPLCESYLTRDHLNGMEPFYPLHVRVCSHCFLVQFFEAYVRPRISSAITPTSPHIPTAGSPRPSLYRDGDHPIWPGTAASGHRSGQQRRISAPALHRQKVESAGDQPRAKTWPVRRNVRECRHGRCFGVASAALVREGQRADLLICNNVLAQVPDLRKLVAGLRIALAPQGVLTLEFPHLLRLIEGNQFDTIFCAAFFVFLVHHNGEPPGRIRVDGVRRGGACDPRRFAAGVRTA